MSASPPPYRMPRPHRLFLAAAAVIVPLGLSAGISAAAGAPAADSGSAPAADGAAAPPPPPPAYEDRLMQLAQVLGSVDYLGKLCDKGDRRDWRSVMKTLIETEAKGEDKRVRQLTAAFNRGYRSFASVYVSCTETAAAAEKKYRREGATLAREIAAKFGN